jgi:hypothetical protein
MTYPLFHKMKKSMHLLPPEQLLASQQTIFDTLKTKDKQFAEIKNAQYPLIIKWQMMLGLVLPIQMEIIKKLGYTDEQRALLEYNKQLMDSQQTDTKLREINDQKWDFIFEQAFGMPAAKKMTIEQARSLIADISAGMVAEPFLGQVDQLMKQLPPNADIMNKRQALLSVLLPLHMSIMAKHGFEGEQGYVQAQKALMDHLHDPEIMQKSLQAQEILFRRAGVLG